MDEKTKIILGAVAIILLLAIPIVAYYYGGHGNKNTTTSTTSMPTTTTSTSISSPQTTTVTYTNVETKTITETTTQLVEKVKTFTVMVPSAMEKAKIPEIITMYGISIPKTTVTTVVTGTFNKEEAIIGDDTLSLVYVSGAPVSALFVCCGGSQQVATTGIDLPYSLPMNLQIISPTYENGTFEASIVAPWPAQFGGAITGSMTIDTNVTVSANFTYTVEMNGIIKTVNAVLCFVGSPEVSLTTYEFTVTEPVETTTTTTTVITSTSTSVSTISG